MFHRTIEQASTPIGHQNAEIALPAANRKSGHPKMLAAAPGINEPRPECIDINAIDDTDPVHFRSWRKLTDDQKDDNMFSIENGDGSIY